MNEEIPMQFLTSQHHGHPLYVVKGPEGAVEWRGVGAFVTLYMHYPVDIDNAGEKHRNPCQYVEGGCFPEAGNLWGGVLATYRSGDVEKIEQALQEVYSELAADVAKFRVKLAAGSNA